MNRPWVTIILILTVFSLLSGCQKEVPSPEPVPTPVSEIFPAEHPRDFPENLRWLTEEEKARLVEIALNIAEAWGGAEKGDPYETSIGWIAISPGRRSRFDYDIVEIGIPRGEVDITPPGSSERVVSIGVPDDAEIYPEVTIRFGEPAEWIVHVAIDLDSEEVIFSEIYPARKGIVIPPPSGDVN